MFYGLSITVALCILIYFFHIKSEKSFREKQELKVTKHNPYDTNRLDHHAYQHVHESSRAWIENPSSTSSLDDINIPPDM